MRHLRLAARQWRLQAQLRLGSRLAPLSRSRLGGADEGVGYVQTDWVSGWTQFEILLREGLLPHHRVFEIGCGHLHAALPTMGYVEVGNYVGVDPNEWIRGQAMRLGTVRRAVRSRRPTFLSNEHFDAGPTSGSGFDFLFAHSILSHTSQGQLWEFMAAAARVMKPQAKLIASIDFSEGNRFGNPGTPDGEDTNSPTWVYPGRTYYKWETVRRAAEAAGLSVESHPEFTEMCVRRRPREIHDWIVCVRKDAPMVTSVPGP